MIRPTTARQRVWSRASRGRLARHVLARSGDAAHPVGEHRRHSRRSIRRDRCSEPGSSTGTAGQTTAGSVEIGVNEVSPSDGVLERENLLNETRRGGTLGDVPFAAEVDES